jgi:hypothetical protein
VCSILRQEDDGTTVVFKHLGWKDPVEFMHHSAQVDGLPDEPGSPVETGAGAPDPRDVRIDYRN